MKKSRKPRQKMKTGSAGRRTVGRHGNACLRSSERHLELPLHRAVAHAISVIGRRLHRRSLVTRIRRRHVAVDCHVAATRARLRPECDTQNRLPIRGRAGSARQLTRDVILVAVVRRGSRGREQLAYRIGLGHAKPGIGQRDRRDLRRFPSRPRRVKGDWCRCGNGGGTQAAADNEASKNEDSPQFDTSTVSIHARFRPHLVSQVTIVTSSSFMRFLNKSKAASLLSRARLESQEQR